MHLWRAIFERYPVILLCGVMGGILGFWTAGRTLPSERVMLETAQALVPQGAIIDRAGIYGIWLAEPLYASVKARHQPGTFEERVEDAHRIAEELGWEVTSTRRQSRSHVSEIAHNELSGRITVYERDGEWSTMVVHDLQVERRRRQLGSWFGAILATGIATGLVVHRSRSRPSLPMERDREGST